jgi:hypothetical protein
MILSHCFNNRHFFERRSAVIISIKESRFQKYVLAKYINRRSKKQFFFVENSRTKRGDVSDIQELEAVLEHVEMLQSMSDFSPKTTF